MIGIIMGIVILLLLISGSVFFYTTPDFGGKVTAEQKNKFEKLSNYKDGIFINQIETVGDFSFSNVVDIMKDVLKGSPDRQPQSPQPVLKLDSAEIADYNGGETRVTWFGHSAFLIEIDGKRLLIDPMLSDRSSPVSFMGPERYTKDLPITAEKLPQIDAVVLSHDHYDHLDYKTIMKIKNKVNHFYVPLGVSVHLLAWGVPSEKISEYNWWDETEHEGVKLIFAPARHFSGRGMTDRTTTLWGAWIIQGKTKKIYFSGDSGYGPHFKETGEKFGPFDIAMLECGQYNERWKAFHMMPEETAQAAADLGAKVFIPIHWGSFTLALHSWKDPIERVTAKAEELKIPVATPMIGERIVLEKDEYPVARWWEKVN
ncbi:MAG: MBL fold metallo-hydrolase [Ignavibacteriales bacterium]|nr:MAG: MBL fold metallo-hydrolase [Ignavibacteriales bacterium]